IHSIRRRLLAEKAIRGWRRRVGKLQIGTGDQPKGPARNERPSNAQPVDPPEVVAALRTTLRQPSCDEEDLTEPLGLLDCIRNQVDQLRSEVRGQSRDVEEEVEEASESLGVIEEGIRLSGAREVDCDRIALRLLLAHWQVPKKG